MRAIVLVALLLLAGASGALATDAKDCKLTQVASLPLVGKSRPVIEVSIGGKKYHFLIDTGGITSVIDSDVVAQLGLTPRAITSDVELYDLSGNVSKKFVRVENFMLDRLKAEHIDMVVQDRDKEEGDIDGILGPDVLAHYDVDFDFGAGQFKLFLPHPCAGNAVYWSTEYEDIDFSKSGGHIVVPMTLDGHNVSATLDTGSTKTLLAEHVAHFTYDLEETSPGVEVMPGAAPGDLVRARYRFKSLSVGGLAINNPMIYILRDLAQESFRWHHHDKEDFDPIYSSEPNFPSLILGMNVLSKLHLYIAYNEDKIYLTGAGAH